jgi:hypothetical protein
MPQLFELIHDSKVLELEGADGQRSRLVLTLSKLGQVTKLDFILTADEAKSLALVLLR